MVAVSSWTSQSCPILKTLFYFSHSKLWTYILSVPLLWWPMTVKHGVWCTCSICTHPYLLIPYILTNYDFYINHSSVHKETSLMRSKNYPKHIFHSDILFHMVYSIECFISNIISVWGFSQILSLFYFLDWIPLLINLYVFLLLEIIHAFFCFNSFKILLLYSLFGSYSKKFSLETYNVVLEISKGDNFGFYVYIFALEVNQLKLIYWLFLSFIFHLFLFSSCVCWVQCRNALW